MPRPQSPDEFNETRANTPQISRAVGCLHVLGIIAPAGPQRALDARSGGPFGGNGAKTSGHVTDTWGIPNIIAQQKPMAIGVLREL